MKKLLRISALMTAALMIFIMIGCGGDDEEKDTTPPELKSASPASGATLPANATITLTFSEKMGSVTVSPGTATLGADGKTATVAPAGERPAGALTISVNGSDVAGNAMTAASLSYTVTASDKDAPKIDDAACDPKNGATGVDPAKVSEIKIVFNEPMATAKLDAAGDLEGKVSAEFDKNKTLKVSFLGGFKLGNEMEIKLTISGTDLAGNALATTTYSFTTMKKEG